MPERNTNPFFNFSLTPQQESLFSQLKRFVNNDSCQVFILRGYAGTGKSTLMSGFIKWMNSHKVSYELLASTGRAAKVLSDKTASPAKTVHSHIYSFSGINEDLEELSKIMNEPFVEESGQLRLMFDVKPASHLTKVYIVDESSMISDKKDVGLSFAHFGTGFLLTDLLNFNKSGKFLFVGDHIQLPPVNQPLSPALSKSYIENKFNLRVEEFELTDVIRQEKNSGIANLSLYLRKQYFNNPLYQYVLFWFNKYQDVYLYSSQANLINKYIETIINKGYEYSILICQSNKSCSEINHLIRLALKKSENTVDVDDILLVTQNNYLVDLVNGDFVKVIAKGDVEYKAGLRFRNIIVENIYNKDQFNTLLIEDVLYSSTTNITAAQHRNLLIDFSIRMREYNLTQYSPGFYDAMMSDPYLNALKAVYGYAVTCHKSQGGEWDEVFLYLNNKIQGIPRPGVYQWMYTAVTRARKKLHIKEEWFIK